MTPPIDVILTLRQRFVEKWCAERGKTIEDLTWLDVMAIRAEPDWIDPKDPK
jgi:hypothetical protein